jgi:hypothetical protein
LWIASEKTVDSRELKVEGTYRGTRKVKKEGKAASSCRTAKKALLLRQHGQQNGP